MYIVRSCTHTEKTKIDKGHQSTESESNNAHRCCVHLSITRSEEGLHANCSKFQNPFMPHHFLPLERANNT